jgi:hypothetical protein
MIGRTSRLNRTAAGRAGSIAPALASAAVNSPRTGATPSLISGVVIGKQ